MMVSGWKTIESAPQDGKPVYVKRVYKGRVVYEGMAAWRTVPFPALHDPITGAEFAASYEGIGWMYVDREKRVPTPTHWMPKCGGCER